MNLINPDLNPTVVEIRCPCGQRFNIRSQQSIKTRTCSRCSTNYKVKLSSGSHVAVMFLPMGYETEYKTLDEGLYSVLTEGE